MKSIIPGIALLSMILTTPVRGQEQDFEEVYFPILVNGVLDSRSHLQTVFRFIETSGTTASQAASVVMDLFDNSGDPTFAEQAFCPGPVAGIPPVVVFDLQGSGSTHFGTKGFIQPYEPEVGVVDGWARVRVRGPGRVSATAELLAVGELPTGCPPVICRRPSAAYLGDTLLQTAPPAMEFRSAAVIAAYRQVAYSIVNPSPSSTAQVSIELLDASGGLVRRGGPVAVPPMNRVSRFAWELATATSDPDTDETPPPDDFYGSARIVSDSPIVVGGLQVLLPEGKLVSLLVTPHPPAAGLIGPDRPEGQ